MGTNKPVKITDAKSGLIRRLIDVSPSGNKLSQTEYATIMNQIKFELGAIAYHCREIYLSNPNKYDNYIPITMLGASNDFYNFVEDSFLVFKKENGTTLSSPNCSSIFEKSRLLLSTRAGVPVLNLLVWIP